jgi:hypothetical protein
MPIEIGIQSKAMGVDLFYGPVLPADPASLLMLIANQQLLLRLRVGARGCFTARSVMMKSGRELSCSIEAPPHFSVSSPCNVFILNLVGNGECLARVAHVAI